MAAVSALGVEVRGRVRNDFLDGRGRLVNTRLTLSSIHV
jgi:hypothetical protein